MTAVIDPRVGERAPAASRQRLGLRDAVDAVFVLVLTGVALFGFRTTFVGTDYLVTGMVAAVIGVAISLAVTVARKTVALTAAAVVVAYFLFSGLLVFRAQAPGGVLPSWTVVRDLATVTVDCWKRLLTTLPPVATNGPLLAIPYLIGMVSASVSAGIAQRTRSRFLPALPPTLALIAVILLGTSHPSARLWQGITFGCVVICWAAVRRSESRTITVRGVPGAGSRLLIGAAVLGLAGAGAVLIGPHLPGHDARRVVLRSYVKPPFDLSAYPSPLVGFRKYTKDAHLLYDQTLFTVKGLPADTSIRLATLDDYDGTVWGATNGIVPAGPGEPLDAFQRVGSRINSDATGKAATVQVDVAAAYAGSADIDAWVPTIGTLSSIRFGGPHATSHEEAFRYNLATGTGIVADRLSAGDTYTLRAVAPVPAATQSTDVLPPGAAPSGTPSIDPSIDGFVSNHAIQWAGKATGIVAKAEAVAQYMRTNGAYSDGGAGKVPNRPGHSVGRLSDFLDAQQLIGDDEQYAAAYALICNYLGLPARVVLVAGVGPGGVVKGSSVRVAVDVHITTGSAPVWYTIPHERFMPPDTTTPHKPPEQSVKDAQAAVVPPPNPVRPPSTLDEPDRPEQNTQHVTKTPPKPHRSPLARVSLAVVKYVGIPLLAIGLVCGLIIGAKWRRRTLRRTRGSIPNRFDAAWRDFLDWARDLGAVVPGGRTRAEQAAVLALRPAGDRAPPLAAVADAGVFGPGVAPDAVLAAYWDDVAEARQAMARAAGRFGPLRAALSLRSLRRPSRGVRLT